MKLVCFVVLFHLSVLTLLSKDTTETDIPITGKVMIDGYLAECTSSCVNNPKILKNCHYTDKEGKRHFSNGHCPGWQEYMYKDGVKR